MKTAQFEYTHKTEVDSSLAQAVYYNANDRTMAVEFVSGIYNTGSAIYEEVPQAFYEGFVTLDSIGKNYNSFVKSTFKNVSEGTVYDVEYVDYNSKQAPEETNTYIVHGYIRVKTAIDAKNSATARQLFLADLIEDGYESETLAVTEVEIVG